MVFIFHFNIYIYIYVLHVCMYVYELKEVIIQYKRSYNNLQMKVKTQFFSFKYLNKNEI